MLEHGGRLRRAARDYGIPMADWLDLSTGINPDMYPVPAIDPLAWQRLPEDDDGLEAAAAAYYGSGRLLALPGSQAAIQALPSLFAPMAVVCVSPLYEEHPRAWERAGHRLRRLPSLQRALSVMTPLVLLCNPNNPTAERIPRDALLDAAKELRQRGGWLVVDEAFGDPAPEDAVAALAGCDAAPNLIALRSLGKFFGLAGARVGFVFAAADRLDRLRETIGPWSIAHPSRGVARRALEDAAWQAVAREKLAAASRRLAEMLSPLGAVRRTALFCAVEGKEGAPLPAAALAGHFARRAILVRRFDAHGLLRFGLPGGEAGWRRLEAAVSEWQGPAGDRRGPEKPPAQG
jgi:cobalamin biosynthetic protein CobC